MLLRHQRKIWYLTTFENLVISAYSSFLVAHYDGNVERSPAEGEREQDEQQHPVGFTAPGQLTKLKRRARNQCPLVQLQ